MKAIILAAGLGKRMRPLTEHTPKPLLKVAGKYLIEYHLQRLAEAGIRDVVINTHWLAEQFPEALGNGERWCLNIQYSHEAELLETAGGILNALPLFQDEKNDTVEKDEPFLVINGDIYSDLDLSLWLKHAPDLNDASKLAYLAMIDNPAHNPEGDFYLDAGSGCLSLSDSNGSASSVLSAYTYSGIALFHPDFFSGLIPGPKQLGPLLKNMISSEKVCGSLIKEYWLDVGTPERFEHLESHLSQKT